jgi:hypothetical protein
MMPLSLSYDHRLVDGAAAARFLNEVKGLFGVTDVRRTHGAHVWLVYRKPYRP